MWVNRKAIYREVAELHATGINQGFLPSLGLNFLALLYEAIDSAESSVLLIECDQDRVLGFVSGAISLVPIYKALLKKPVTLIATLLPVLLEPSKVWRILELITHTLRSFRKKSEEASFLLPKFELISISVSPDARRSGVAHRLYDGLKEAAKARGFEAFQITVGEGLDGAHKFYTRMGAVPVSKISVHGDEISVVYVQEL